MEKRNTGVVILIIALGVLVVGLGGYIMYDKVFLSNAGSAGNNDEIKDETLMKDVNETMSLMEEIRGFWFDEESLDFVSFEDMDVGTVLRDGNIVKDYGFYLVSSVHKMEENNFKFDLIFPSHLSGELYYNTEAKVSTVIVDLSKISSKIIVCKTSYGSQFREFKYVADTFENFQLYVDNFLSRNGYYS